MIIPLVGQRSDTSHYIWGGKENFPKKSKTMFFAPKFAENIFAARGRNFVFGAESRWRCSKAPILQAFQAIRRSSRAGRSNRKACFFRGFASLNSARSSTWRGDWSGVVSQGALGDARVQSFADAVWARGSTGSLRNRTRRAVPGRDASCTVRRTVPHD